MSKVKTVLAVVGGAALLVYIARELRKSANADTQAVTNTTKGEKGNTTTLNTSPIKYDPGFVAGAETSSTIPRYATPNLGSLQFRNVYDKFMPFGNPVSARADFNSEAPPEAKPTIYIN